MARKARPVSLRLAATLCSAVLVIQFEAQAGTLRKVWEVDLRKVAHANDGSPDFPVFALRFSPDGRKLAVIADIYKTHEGIMSRLLVHDLNHPAADVRQFEVPFGILENEHGRFGALNFGWAPSGEIIYALGKVIHLRSGTTCELSNQSVFLTDNLAISTGLSPLESRTRFTFFNQDCEEREKWEVQENWLIRDVSIDRSLLSVMKDIGPGVAESLIVDPLGRRVLQRWSGKDVGAWEFADSGKAVCTGGAVLQAKRAPALCRNVDTGKEIGETLKTNGAEPIATAARMTRAVVSDYRREKIPFDYEYRTAFKGRVAWDFRTGQDLASWRPESETYLNTLFAPPKQITEPFRFAMSPDGQYIAEGGNGIIRLYKIEQ